MKDSEILIYLENDFLHNFKIGLELAKNSKKLRRISDFARKLTEREYTYRYSYYLDKKIAKFCYLVHPNIEKNLRKIVRYSKSAKDDNFFLIEYSGLCPFDERGIQKPYTYHYWQNINFRINNGKTIWQTKNKT